jgi:DNA-directed RNA polymerase subunit RPC12/RpoP
MTIMEPMNANETDDLFDPDAALLASEAEWDARLNRKELVECSDCSADVDEDIAVPWNNDAGEVEGYRCPGCYAQLVRWHR